MRLLVVSGVGGASETAEAILLLDLVVVFEEGSIASAAFLFLSWEEMMSTVEGTRWVCQEDRIPGSRHTRLRTGGCDTRAGDSGRGGRRRGGEADINEGPRGGGAIQSRRNKDVELCCCP